MKTDTATAQQRDTLAKLLKDARTKAAAIGVKVIRCRIRSSVGFYYRTTATGAETACFASYRI